MTSAAVERHPVLELDGIQRDFQGAQVVRAVRDATFAIRSGEAVAITGRSGSGKSTLLNLLGLLDHPTAGAYKVDGKDTFALNESERTALRSTFFGFVFQQAFLLATRTAQENVELPLVPTRTGRKERSSRAGEMLERVGLGARRHFLPTTLSGGECQRVAIARALVHRPSVLLCDEPTGNLDTRTTAEIMELLTTVGNSQQMTLVVVTHDTEIAESLPRALSVSDGVVAELARS